MARIVRDKANIATNTDSAAQRNPDTLPRMLKHNFEKHADNIAMRYKRYGIWQRLSWKEYYLDMKYLALGFIAAGFEPGDKVAIIGDNSPQWYCAELAAQANRGTSVGMPSDLSPHEIKYIISNSESKFAIVEDQEQVDKLLEIAGELPQLKKIVYWNYKGLSHYESPLLTGYDQILQTGIQYDETHPGVFEENIEKAKPEDICAIIYTSGTTETNPKGALHSHKTLKAIADSYFSVDPWFEGDNVFSYLPPAWMTEQIFGVCCHLLSACVVHFAEEPETQQQDMREIGPDIFFANTRIWESLATRTQARILGAKGIKKWTINKFLPVGYKIAELKQKKKTLGFSQKTANIFSNLALFRPVRDSLGLSNIRACYSTGGILSPDIVRFYHALNIPLKSIYQSAETGILSCADNSDIRIDTQGVIVKGFEARITEKGELICKHQGMFLGYHNAPDKTKTVLKDSWLYTGDVATINENNHLVIIDRMENIIELATGDKLAPQPIESQLKSSPYIRDAWVLTGSQKSYPAAIIIINYDNVGRWADRRRIIYTTFSDLSQKPDIYRLIKEEISKVNNKLALGLRIKKFINFHRELDPDEGELTRNRKLRRAFLYERYADTVSAIYDNSSEIQIITRIQQHDGRPGTSRTTIKIESIEGVS